MTENELRQTVAFLGRRIAGTAGANGISSDALIVAALTGRDPTGRPHDLDDFARCCAAFAHAPTVLRVRMLPWIRQWADDLKEATY